MLTIKGIYNGKDIEILEPVPNKNKYKVIITFVEEIFDSEEINIRDFGSLSTGFNFWKDEKEDLYQDYLPKA